MNAPDISLIEARLELALLQAEANVTRSADLYLWMRESGLSPEVSASLYSLAGQNHRLDGRLVTLGKILVLRLSGFAKRHPDLTTADACAAGIDFLITRAPMLAPLLQPLARALEVEQPLLSRQGVPEASVGACFAPLAEMLMLLCDVESGSA